ncbi:WD repeat-containing protein 74 [Thrips palmi]|uniref:WD repeat-containing protein 74 n=1 Tax=Thrips palmi TaxID=161013 RepID=A0A6P8ZJ57_THRPL|nr:WD repeat-containing protein 74 [Thrips palmi]
MSFKDDFNIFIGAKYGIFKGVKATEGQPLITKSIKNVNFLSKDTDVTAMSWNDENEECILMGLSNQVVSTYDTNAKYFSSSTNIQTETEKLGKSEGSICGLSRYNGALVTATESGHISVFRLEDDQCINIHAGGPVSKMRHSMSNPSIIGTGGLENELKLWDLNTGKKTFESKNVPLDFLQLRVKVWVTDHVFMPSSDNVAVGSKYGYVRLYDPKAQRRPVVNVNMPEMAVTCIASTGDDHTVLCGLAKGNIVAVDLRMGRTAQNYKGFVGAVRDIACHPTEPYIVSVGLDRFLRVHHKTTKKILLKEYMVSRMSCVLMRSSFDFNHKVGKGSQNKSHEKKAQKFEDMFDSMEVVIDGPSKEKNSKGVTEVPKETETPPKRKKSLIVNPFSDKKKRSKPLAENTSPKTSLVRQSANSKETQPEDSDDDIMILDEIAADSQQSKSEGDESDVDEADGDSDELDEENDDSENNTEVAHKSASRKRRRC